MRSSSFLSLLVHKTVTLTSMAQRVMRLSCRKVESPSSLQAVAERLQSGSSTDDPARSAAFSTCSLRSRPGGSSIDFRKANPDCIQSQRSHACGRKVSLVCFRLPESRVLCISADRCRHSRAGSSSSAGWGQRYKGEPSECSMFFMRSKDASAAGTG